MADTLAAAKTALYNLLAVDASGRPKQSLTKVRRVYKGEPRAKEAEKPIAVTVASTRITDQGFVVTVRVYAATDTDPLAAQDDLDETVDQIETLLEADSTFRRGNWTIGYVEALEALVAACDCEAFRPGF